jgi:hypothetical protein
VTTEGETNVMESLERKASAADRMFDSIVAEMNNEFSINRSQTFTANMEKPKWM